MSDILSFRLNIKNPREAQALQILEKWCAKGYSLRYVLTQALLELDHPGSDLEMGRDDQDLGLVLHQIGRLLEIIQKINDDPITRQKPDPDQPILRDGFLVSIKQAAKPGIRLESGLKESSTS
jgi:hypothetical protein